MPFTTLYLPLHSIHHVLPWMAVRNLVVVVVKMSDLDVFIFTAFYGCALFIIFMIVAVVFSKREGNDE